MTLEEELTRAHECNAVLNNPYVREALSEIREALVSQWQRTPIVDTPLREKIWAIYNGALKFEELLRSHIETGKLAAIDIERKQSLLERAKQWAA